MRPTAPLRAFRPVRAKQRSRAAIRLYGRRFGYVPSIQKSRALERIRRLDLRPAFLAAMRDLDAQIEHEQAR